MSLRCESILYLAKKGVSSVLVVYVQILTAISWPFTSFLICKMIIFTTKQTFHRSLVTAIPSAT